MRHLISFTLIVLVFLLACDNRGDYWANINYFDSFQLIKSSGDTLNSTTDGYSDTVKTNLATEILYNINHAKDCKVSFEYNTNLCDIALNSIDKAFTITCFNAGELDFTITVLNPFGQALIKNIHLQSVENKVPIAAASIKNSGILDKYEIEIDAALSYDTDNKIGGTIIAYEYEIVGICKDIIKKNKYKRILSKPGTYTIKVRVMDNDLAWSSIKVFAFTLE